MTVLYENEDIHQIAEAAAAAAVVIALFSHLSCESSLSQWFVFQCFRPVAEPLMHCKLTGNVDIHMLSFLCRSTAGHSSIELFPLLCRLLWRKQRRVTFQTLTRRSRSIFPISNLLIPPEVETEHFWFLSDALQHMETVTECYMGVCLSQPCSLVSQ
jgi:hypothetical protein